MLVPNGIQLTSNYAASSESDARMQFLCGSVTNDVEFCVGTTWTLQVGRRLSYGPQLILQNNPLGINCRLTLIIRTVNFINQIMKHLSSAISSPTYPPALRNACQLGLQITNKYYSLTDSSPLYQIAIISKLGRETKWITKAIRLAREMWVSFYKPKPVEPTPSSSSSNNWPKTSMLAGLGGAATARGRIVSSNPLDIWLAGGLILDGNDPVNPLKWWSQQKRVGNTHGALVHMALDVLSCTATLVDVEKAFSFGRDYVSSKKHRLTSDLLSRGMTVAFYSKNGLIKEGLLAKWKAGIQASRKVNVKDKGKKKVIVLDEDWSETNKCSQLAEI
ncbi:hypothetical protein PSTG_07634 [Puccinia striiformis f. sp. tritici PST-78]|uniref:HAT C-terminal dimerisation domain-containing protein n=1 Tax=Puccinia striiformis f. sp. tritici PST-78 TaxID=1165861 RepID=A0A0L0VIP1_9BASI|nr:hypothetical protein PSTG_07634 [Puccinia striiformis f. sp. tritici PST-78]